VVLIFIQPVVSGIQQTIREWPSVFRMLFEPVALMPSEFFRVHRMLVSGLIEQGLLATMALVPVSIVHNAIEIAALTTGATRKIRRVVSLAIDRLVSMQQSGLGEGSSWHVRCAWGALCVHVCRRCFLSVFDASTPSAFRCC